MEAGLYSLKVLLKSIKVPAAKVYLKKKKKEIKLFIII